MTDVIITASRLEKMISYVKEIVEEHPGIKVTELVIKLISRAYEDGESLKGDEIPMILDCAVQQEAIMEIAFILAGTNHREKSIYFPKETKLSYKGKELWNK